jgi:hypothetical protein
MSRVGGSDADRNQGVPVNRSIINAHEVSGLTTCWTAWLNRGSCAASSGAWSGVAKAP